MLESLLRNVDYPTNFILIGMVNDCHEDMTGKGGRMSQGERYKINL